MKPLSGDFYGKYAGRVVSTSDPLKLGRVKIRVPVIHGINGSDSGLVGDEDLPWALPSSLPAGGSQESGGISWIPTVDDQIWVEFLDGELDKPIWTWGNQNQPQAAKFSNLPLHKYEGGDAARRSAMTRFSHWWELSPAGHDIWTKSGYHFTIIDEQTPGMPSGKFNWITALGYLLSLDDATETLVAFAPHIEDTCQTESINATTSFDLTTPLIGLNFGSIQLGGNYQNFQIDGVAKTSRGLRVLLNQLTLLVTADVTAKSAIWNSTQSASFSVTAPAVNLTGGATIGMSAPAVSVSSAAGELFNGTGPMVKIGLAASDPVVRLSDLVLALTLVKTMFDAHTHKGVQGGSSTSGPPSIPAVLAATGSASVLAEPATITTLPVA
jgi:hypothetical protein